MAGISSIILVATGGALGVLMRHGLVLAAMRLNPGPFPIGTMLVNILGSFAIGVLMARFIASDSEAGRLFFVTGLLGGFTTFSAFSWDTLQLLQRGQTASAAFYVGGSVLLSLVAVMAGFRIAAV
jgi:fluoride exporter